MARYTEQQIEEVRERNDIVDVIGEYVSLKRAGSSYMGLCPFHNEKTPSFSVSPSRQMYKCFGCGVAGNVITFVMEYENLTFPEAMEHLAKRAGIELPKAELTKEQKQEATLREKLLEINRTAAMFYYSVLKSEYGKQGLAYLKERGLTDETIVRFGLGYAGQGGHMLYNYLRKKGYNDGLLKETGLFKMDERGAYDKFWNRVMFPILDANNRVIGFGGRVMGDAKPKYLNSPETKLFDKSKNLFGLNYAKKGNRKQMILCEGYMDVIAMHQAGFTNAVASLGTAFTLGQATILHRYVDEVILSYDSDGAGIKAALRAIPMLREVGITSKILNLQPHKDPDEFIKAEGHDAFQERLDKAENSFFFEVEQIQKKYDLRDPEGKTQFYQEVAKHLLVFDDKIQRDNYADAIADRYSIRREDLQKLIVKYGNQMSSNKAFREAMQEKKIKNDLERTKLKQEGGIASAYRLYFSFLTEYPKIYAQVKDYVLPSDFLDETYEEVAKILYAQLDKGVIMPADIVNHFNELSQHNIVANMFQTKLEGDLTSKEKEEAINEIIYKIKENSLDYHIRNLTDPSKLQILIQEKKDCQQRKKLHISL